MYVPATVPSVRHNSRPLVESFAEKYRTPLTLTRLVGSDDPAPTLTSTADCRRLDGDALVLERPRLGADPDPPVDAQRLGAGGREQDLGAGVDHGTGDQRELGVVADQDADAAEAGVEDLERVAWLDQPLLALEAGHDQLVL
jgi:hypothetical protein